MNRTKKNIILIMVFAVGFGVWFVAGYTLPVYQYETSDHGMQAIEVPWKGRPLEVVEAEFEQYKNQKADPNIELLRTTKRIWAAPNLWWDNITNRRWRIQYADPSQSAE